jgi:phytoene dehydrogenase-like protein
VADRTFFAGPMSNPWSLAKRMRSPFDLTAIDPLRTLHRSAEAFFDDPRLVQWADRYATYSGSSPYGAPATLACIPHIEARFGCWYPMGGLDALRAAFERVAVDAGVEIRTGTEVTSIDAADAGHRCRAGRRTTSGPTSWWPTPTPSTCTPTCSPTTSALKRVRERSPIDERVRPVPRRARPHTTGATTTCGSPRATAAEYDQLDAGRLADDPTIYACVSSVTDPARRPTAARTGSCSSTRHPTASRSTPRPTATSCSTGSPPTASTCAAIEFRHTMTPSDIARRYRSPGGAIYGTSSNGKRAAFVRPANRGARPGLYLVGGSSHPGGGLPLVTTSAKIVAEMITEDLAMSDLAPPSRLDRLDRRPARCRRDRPRAGSPRPANTAPPVRPTLTPLQSISVVIPARDEADPHRAAARRGSSAPRRRRGDRGRRPVERRHRRDRAGPAHG